MCRAAAISYSVVAARRPLPRGALALPPRGARQLVPGGSHRRPAPSYAACLNKWCGAGRPPRPGSSPHESRLLRGRRPPTGSPAKSMPASPRPRIDGGRARPPRVTTAPPPRHAPPRGVRIRKFVAWCPARLTRPPGALGHLSLHRPGAPALTRGHPATRPTPAPGDTG